MSMNRLDFIKKINTINANPEDFANVLVNIFDPIMILYDLLDGREYGEIENVPQQENMVTCFSISYPTNESATEFYTVISGYTAFYAYNREFHIQSSIDENKIIVYIY